MALGAQSGDALRMVPQQGMTPVLAGICAGGWLRLGYRNAADLSLGRVLNSGEARPTCKPDRGANAAQISPFSRNTSIHCAYDIGQRARSKAERVLT
jgi:hypothetical protein